ncbi:divalent-cation tolerance protein CutA [Nocardia shimofusensis]|uniref:divalent-cation tolerance protein CutA n=1 Tax=Nocardia shimofusensis TaxID=228596 RepID=UPI00082EC4E3|nr:divalent cation tolerance protein CutA [Nocardia shimofusensis]
MTDVWSLVTTAPTEDDANRIADTLVVERLAGAAWVSGPVRSSWWHLGESGNGQEWRIEVRTTGALRDRLAARITELHPWDNPELTGHQVDWCPDNYRQWIETSTATTT